MVRTRAVVLTAAMLVLGGCMATIPYWKGVEKAQQERLEAEDQLQWNERETPPEQQESSSEAARSQAIAPSEY